MHTFKTIRLALLLIIFSVVPLVPILSSVANAGENTKYRLIVNATPSDSRIIIMNIKPKYRHGIALKSGKYDIEVTRSGYESKRGWVEIKNADLSIDVILNKLGARRVNKVISSEADDAALIQYALQLRKTKPDLFAGAQGVLVLKIEPNSQAEKKGLRRGDIIVAYNGQQMNSTEQLISTIQANAAKPQAELQFIRVETVQVLVLQGGQIGIRLTDITEEVSLEQFSEKFFTAIQAKDINKIWQLLINNPNTAEQFQKVLTRVGEDELAGLVGKWRQSLSAGDSNSVLNRLQEEGAKAYYEAKYFLALEKWQAGLDKALELGERYYISQFINNLGMVYNDLGQYQTALDSFQQALTIHREIKNRRGEGSTLGNIGAVYDNLGQYQIALDYHQQALAIDREFKNRRGEGNTLTNIGSVYQNLGQYQTALDSFQQALTIDREIKDKRGEGADLGNIGNVYDNLGQYQTALDYHQQSLKIKREIKDRRGEGNTLTNIGSVYQNLGQYQTALDSFQQALAIHREIKDRRGEGSDLGNIGVLYANLAQYQTALDYFQQALKIKRKIKDRRGEGSIFGNIGGVYDNLGQYQTALDYHQQSLTIDREIKNRRGEGSTLGNIGAVYDNLGQYQTALDYHQQSLKIKREIKDRRGEGSTLGNIGNVHANLGQYQTALDYHLQALKIEREIENRRGEGSTLTNLGGVYNDLAQYQTALDYYQQALTIHREIKDRHGEGADLSNIGNVYDNLAQYQTALDYHQQALAIGREIKDRRGEGSYLGNIGGVYQQLGQYQTALDYYQQALTIAREIKYRRGEGASLGNIGAVYWSLGQYQTALDYFQQALTIERKIKNRRGEGACLNNIGNVYDDLGQYQTALDYYQQSLTIDREIKNRRGEGGDLGNIGMGKHNLGEYQTALDHYQQALTIAREIKDKRGEGMALSNIGVAHGDLLGEYQTALDYFQKALTIYRKIKDRRGEGTALGNIGDVYQNLGKYQQAKAALQDSATLLETVGSDDLWEVQRGLAFTEAKLNQPELAIQHYEQSIDNIEKLRAGLTEKEHKISFMYRKLPVYDEFIVLLQSLHSNHPKKGYDRKAIEIFERKQGRVFLEEMGKSGARRFAGIPENIVQNETERVQKIEAARKSHLEALAQGKNAEPHRKRLEKLQAEQAEFEKTLQTNYPAYYALKYPKPVALKTLQKNVLQADELMLIYNIRKEATDLWVVGKEHFASFTLPLTEAQMQQQVTQFRDVGIKSMLNEIDTAKQRRLKDTALMRHLAGAVEENLPDFVETSDALYQQLLPEAARQLVAKAKPSTLYIVPTGALYNLPFESLVTAPDEDEPHYLLQDYAIAYLSSASLLKTLRESQGRREIMERAPLLAFADPEYPQKSCQALSQGDSTKGLRTRAYKKLLGGEGICFPPLPETADEVKAIAQLFHVNSYSQPKPLHLKEDASVKTIEQFNEDEELDNFQYVLFSTHAILPDEISYIKQPALVLSHPEKNGYLKMADVFGLKMNADLVMLSACNTGRGYTFKGEGVRGLTRAFMYAGTPAVAVTLWSVESLASQQLGIHLFTQLKKKEPLAKGLQQAKLAMLKNDNSHYRHPYFWAGFVVFGDGL